MLTKHVSRRLAAYIDGELGCEALQQIASHIDHCTECRAEYDQVKLGIESLDYLPKVAAPDTIWISLDAAFARHRSRTVPIAALWRLSFAAAALLALVLAAYWILARRPDTRWIVVRLSGSPTIGASPIGAVANIGAGEWIETDSESTARVTVGSIGSVEIAPNTRLRLVKARPDEHRFNLIRGTIQAKISAPPRLFFVNTISGTAVDMGCEYTLNIDEDGYGLLRVTKGWVAFDWKGLESLVPAGATCRMRPQTGPGIPYFEDAPDGLRQALNDFGLEKAGDSLSVILATCRVRDTLTLWHLLWRVDALDRARVYDRIAALTPVPPGVSRDRALALDPETLRIWKDELAWTW